MKITEEELKEQLDANYEVGKKSGYKRGTEDTRTHFWLGSTLVVMVLLVFFGVFSSVIFPDIFHQLNINREDYTKNAIKLEYPEFKDKDITFTASDFSTFRVTEPSNVPDRDGVTLDKETKTVYSGSIKVDNVFKGQVQECASKIIDEQNKKLQEQGKKTEEEKKEYTVTLLFCPEQNTDNETTVKNIEEINTKISSLNEDSSKLDCEIAIKYDIGDSDTCSEIKDQTNKLNKELEELNKDKQITTKTDCDKNVEMINSEVVCVNDNDVNEQVEVTLCGDQIPSGKGFDDLRDNNKCRIFYYDCYYNYYHPTINREAPWWGGKKQTNMNVKDLTEEWLKTNCITYQFNAYKCFDKYWVKEKEEK